MADCKHEARNPAKHGDFCPECGDYLKSGGTKAAEDKAGHGNMKVFTIGGKVWRSKPTEWVEAYVLARLVEKGKRLGRDALALNVPETTHIITSEETFDRTRFAEFVALAQKVQEASVKAGKDYLAARKCYVVFRDLKDERKAAGYEVVDMLDVKVGQHTFDDREGLFRNGKVKSAVTRAQMETNERDARAGGAWGYQIAASSWSIVRFFAYKDSRKNLLTFLENSCAGVVTRLEELLGRYQKEELAAVGSSILLVKCKSKEPHGAFEVFPFFIDPAHGFFRDDIEPHVAALNKKYAESPKFAKDRLDFNFFDATWKNLVESVQRMIEDDVKKAWLYNHSEHPVPFATRGGPAELGAAAKADKKPEDPNPTVMNEDGLKQEEGFPPAHTRAFLDVARSENAYILTRTPGASCEGPLAEGYAAKSFHIKAKSCNFGASAGFLCLDPYLNKSGRKGAYDNLKNNYKSLTQAYEDNRTSGAIPLEISDARMQWLCGSNRLRGKWSSSADHYFATCADRDNTLSVDFMLVKSGDRWKVFYDAAKLYGVDNPQSPDARAKAWQKLSADLPEKVRKTPDDLHHAEEYFRALWERLVARAAASPAPSAPIDGASYGHYLPVLAMTNAHPDWDPKSADAYKNAVTGDYDLFAVWPKTFDRALDTRVGGQKVDQDDKQIVAREEGSKIGKVLGNISERVEIIAQLLNSQMVSAKATGNRVYHSDKAGRPFIEAVDSAAVFTPDGRMFMVKNADQLAAVMRDARDKGHVLFANKGWAKHLPADVTKEITWVGGLDDATETKPAPVDARGSAAPAGDAASGQTAVQTVGQAAGPLDERQRALHERQRDVAYQQEDVRLRAEEQKLRYQDAYLRAQENDERLRILAAVRVPMPDVSGKFGPDMEDTKLRNKEFTDENKTSLLNTSSASLNDKASDFFALSKFDRDDLLDRVGFYRGLTIDHGQTEIVQQGFREVLKRPPSTCSRARPTRPRRAPR